LLLLDRFNPANASGLSRTVKIVLAGADENHSGESGADYLRNIRDRKFFRSFPALTTTKLPNNPRSGGRRFFVLRAKPPCEIGPIRNEAHKIASA